jgi:hypothetical protein
VIGTAPDKDKYLLRETGRLLRAKAGLAAGALFLLTALGMASDLYPEYSGPVSLVIFVLLLVLQYEITRMLLVHLGLVAQRAGQRRIWALLGLNFVSDLGIALGFLLFVVPGIYLMVRWSMSVPVLIAEEAGVIDAMKRSGEEVADRFWRLFAVLLVIWLPAVSWMVAAGFLKTDSPLLWSLLRNLPANVALIAGWHAAVAFYASGQSRDNLSAVFS